MDPKIPACPKSKSLRLSWNICDVLCDLLPFVQF